MCNCTPSLSHLCVFPDSSLSSENLSTVLDSMKDSLWDIFSDYVNIPAFEREKIKGQYSSDRERKQAVIPHLISTHPSLSWRLVANALYQMVTGYGGVSCHRALDHLQQKFPTGNTYCTTPPWVISPMGRRRTYTVAPLYTCTCMSPYCKHHCGIAIIIICSHPP